MALIRNEEELGSYLRTKFHMENRLANALVRNAGLWLGTFPISSYDVTRKLDTSSKKRRYMFHNKLKGIGDGLYEQLLQAMERYNREPIIFDYGLVEKYLSDAKKNGYYTINILFKGDHKCLELGVNDRIPNLTTVCTDPSKYVTYIDFDEDKIAKPTKVEYADWIVLYKKEEAYYANPSNWELIGNE